MHIYAQILLLGSIFSVKMVIYLTLAFVYLLQRQSFALRSRFTNAITITMLPRLSLPTGTKLPSLRTPELPSQLRREEGLVFATEEIITRRKDTHL